MTLAEQLAKQGANVMALPSIRYKVVIEGEPQAEIMGVDIDSSGLLIIHLAPKQVRTAETLFGIKSQMYYSGSQIDAHKPERVCTCVQLINGHKSECPYAAD